MKRKNICKKGMKVALVPSTYLPSIGGVQINTHSLAKRLKDIGLDVHVVTRKGGYLSHYTYEGIKVETLPFYLFRGTIKSFLRFIISSAVCLVKGFFIFQRMKPEIVNVHFLGANAFFIMILHVMLPFKMVVTLHGTIEAPSPELEKKEGYFEAKILNWTARRIFHSADAIVCISNYLYEKVVAIYPGLAPKTTIIPIGVERPISDQPGLRKGNMILAAGRLAGEKGFDILIKAFKEISEVHPNHDLFIAGDGEERKGLEESVISLNLAGRVRFLGYVDKTEIMRLLSECTLFVVPSRNEGFGAVILEAMTVGAPIVATSVGAIPEIIKDKETGFLVPAENPSEMAKTLDYLLRNREIAARVGAEAQKRIEAKYDWVRIAEEYQNLYRRILEAS